MLHKIISQAFPWSMNPLHSSGYSYEDNNRFVDSNLDKAQKW